MHRLWGAGSCWAVAVGVRLKRGELGCNMLPDHFRACEVGAKTWEHPIWRLCKSGLISSLLFYHSSGLCSCHTTFFLFMIPFFHEDGIYNSCH